MSKADLFDSGVQLFEGKAKKWFLNNLHKIYSWRDLKERYKRDQLRDRSDEHLLYEAYNRKQFNSEMCADYVEAMQNIFESMDDPPEQKIQVHVAQKNMLNECRIQLVNSGRKFRTLEQLLEHCRDLDMVRKDIEKERSQYQGRSRRTSYQRNEQQVSQNRENFSQNQSRFGSDRPAFREGNENSSQSRNLRWKCWNCGSESHGFRACPSPLNKFCTNCGLQGVERGQCPQCTTNFRRDSGGTRRQ